MKDNTKLEILRISPFWEDELKSIWLEHHKKDLDLNKHANFMKQVGGMNSPNGSAME